MPSITYIEDNRSENEPGRDAEANERRSPEPPTRYSGNPGPAIQPGGQGPNSAIAEFASARRLVTIAQVMAIVSLLIGGVVLSTAALVVAIMALQKVRAHVYTDAQDQLTWQLLKRSTTIAIVVAVLALAANVAALIVIYPMLMEAIQSGEYTTLLGTAQTPNTPGTSTWG